MGGESPAITQSAQVVLTVKNIENKNHTNTVKQKTKYAVAVMFQERGFRYFVLQEAQNYDTCLEWLKEAEVS